MDADFWSQKLEPIFWIDKLYRVGVELFKFYELTKDGRATIINAGNIILW